MYYYIVDPQKISQREFERVQNILYSSLSEYRVAGEVVRVTGLRTINQLVENAFMYGAKTIVAVGSDDTLHDVINAIKGRGTIVGFIPLMDSEIAQILGLKSIEQSARTIGLRRIAEIDLGFVNNPPAQPTGERAGNYFLIKLTFGAGNLQTKPGFFSSLNWRHISSLFNLPTFEVNFSADNSYQASSKIIGGVVISSLTSHHLDVLLLPQLSKLQTLRFRSQILVNNYAAIPGSSVVHVKKFEIINPAGLALKVGNRVIAKTPASIEILPQALKIIVGKDRKF